MPVDARSVAPAPPSPPVVASEGDEPQRTAVQATASPAEAERLGNRIAELSARIQAATYELLVLIREFDAGGAWSGFASCAVWLSWRTGLAPGAAREHVRVAEALAPPARRAAAAGGTDSPGLERAGAGASGQAPAGSGDRHRRGHGAAVAG